jgi:hypothetical protein
MQVLLHEPYTLPALLRADFTKIGEGRSPKRHLSEITRAIKEAAGGNVEAIEGEQDGLRPQAGFLFERALENVWKEYHRETRPVELQFNVELDDIVGTPDGLETLDENLLSMKQTWMSMRKWEEDLASIKAGEPVQHFVEWFAREPGYLQMMRKGVTTVDGVSLRLSPSIRRVRFLVFWVNGDYTRRVGRGVQITNTLLEFADKDLDKNWKTILNYRDWLDKKEKEGQGGEAR